jgi:hypothetical protein
MVTDQAAQDSVSERVVRSTFPRLSEWQAKLAQPYRPADGTDLAVDDDDWPPMPLSTIAWSGLAAAADHLAAIQRHVEARVLFPMSHLTLCRTALVGAAQAVWVLAPDDRIERLVRNRTVTAYLYKNHLQYLRGLQELADVPHVGTDTVAGIVDQRMAELHKKRTAASETAKLNTTRMIEEAAVSAFVEPDIVAQAKLVWQSGSGVAHGLPWPLFGTPGTVQSKEADSNGVAEFQAGGSLGRIGNHYMAAFHLAEHGWRLLGQRGS